MSRNAGLYRIVININESKTPKHQGKAKMATPRKMGQPPKFSSVEALEKKVNEYFDSPDAYMDTPEGPVFAPTMSGLALYLDMDRRSLTNYANRDEFFPTIKKARARVEQHLERKLYGGQVAGVIFNLKNNFGWMDKLEDSSSKDSETVNKIQIEVVNASGATDES